MSSFKKGFVLDDDGLKGKGSRYFRELLSGRQLLVGKGTISHEEAKTKAIAEFEKYRKMEMLQNESDYDRINKELIQKENSLPKKYMESIRYRTPCVSSTTG